MTDDRFAATFRREYPRLVGLAHRVLGDRAEAEEAAQESLLALADHPVADRPDEEVRAWLSRVCANRSLNRLRTRARAAARVAAVGAAELRVVPDDPADLAAAGDERERVRAVLAGLPERQATALLLRHAGHPYAEIADALGVAVGSVGVLLARGERAFRRSWEETPR
jgi:RNA polymerase sigma factor (sigma-70 family)